MGQELPLWCPHQRDLIGRPVLARRHRARAGIRLPQRPFSRHSTRKLKPGTLNRGRQYAQSDREVVQCSKGLWVHPANRRQQGCVCSPFLLSSARSLSSLNEGQAIEFEITENRGKSSRRKSQSLAGSFRRSHLCCCCCEQCMKGQAAKRKRWPLHKDSGCHKRTPSI